MFGLITAASLVLAYYWHGQSVEKRIPMYHRQLGTTLVSKSVPAPSELRVLYKGKELDSEVSAVVVYIWNAGKLPIKAEDVLEPLTIELEPKCEILESRILKVSRPVTKFSTGDVKANAQNRLPLSFSILEQNDGAAIQVVYTGGFFTNAIVKGTVLGAGEPRRGEIEMSFFYTRILPVIFQVSLFVWGILTGWVVATRTRRIRVWSATLAFIVAFMLMFGWYEMEYRLPIFRSQVPPSISTL